MAGNITLTSSMRSNLSSLKSLASQMSTTQTRLSTGKRVNSAIDNANSYYQSRALTNRSSDLDMLLDAMGQSIQTIQSAVQGLEATGEILENAAVIAQNAYEAAIIPEKAWFEAQVGPNGAVVTSAQELKDAVNAGKETICVYGKIDYFENQSLTMKANQKLVGTEYFTGYTGNKKFSEINFSGTQSYAIASANNCLISDLSLNFDANRVPGSSANHLIRSLNNVVLNNLDLKRNIIGTNKYEALNGAIQQQNGGSMTISGVVNLKSYGHCADAIVVAWGAQMNIAKDALVNIDCNITSIYPGSKAAFLIYSGYGPVNRVNIYGKVNINSNECSFKLGPNDYSGNILNIGSSAEVTSTNKFINCGAKSSDTVYNSINITEGAKINLNASGGTSFISQGYIFENNTTSDKYVYASTLRSSGDFTEVACDVDWDNYADTEVEEAEDKEILSKAAEQYSAMMGAYDDMVSDSGYQGVNLIKGGKLTTMFNENRTHSYTIEGKDMSSAGIGITAREWVTKDDIAQSIKEIQNAMNSVRDMVETLGNHLSIIQTRMNFTDAMTDILQTGADDLVLADMNEESANYLALQTRNSLAVNALALAAQSNNSVLKLF